MKQNKINNTFSGQVTRLKKSWSDLLETIAKELGLFRLMDWLVGLMKKAGMK